MTLDETSEILNVIFLNYQNSFKGWQKGRSEAYKQMWFHALENIPSQIVSMAVKDIVFNSNKEFAPNIGQVKTRIIELLTDSPELAADREWRNLRKFIRQMCRYKDDDMNEYMKLSVSTRRIYPYSECLELSRATTEQISYRENQFKRVFSQVNIQNNVMLLDSGKLIELAGEPRLMQLGVLDQVKNIEAKNANNGPLIGCMGK